MNKKRRDELRSVITALETLRDRIDDIRMDIEAIQGEEEEALSNLPESLQESEQGQKMQDAIDNLSYLADDLDGIDIDAFTETIQEIIDA